MQVRFSDSQGWPSVLMFYLMVSCTQWIMWSPLTYLDNHQICISKIVPSFHGHKEWRTTRCKTKYQYHSLYIHIWQLNLIIQISSKMLKTDLHIRFQISTFSYTLALSKFQYQYVMKALIYFRRVKENWSDSYSS